MTGFIALIALRGKDSMPERTPHSNSTRDRSASTASAGSFSSMASPVFPARRPLAVGVWSALLVADTVLIARCWSGEWRATLPPLLAVFSMVVVAVVSHLVWLCFPIDSPRTDISHRAPSNISSPWIPVGVSLVVSVLWCAGLATQSSPQTIGLLVGVTLFQALAVLTMATAEQRLRHGVLRQTDVASKNPPTVGTLAAGLNAAGSIASGNFISEPAPVDSEPNEPEATEFEPVELEGDEQETEASEDITQWMSRRATDDGEVIEGWMRVTFAVGQREATIHVSFCPPLAGTPEIETEDLAGVDLEIRVASAFPFGLRMAVRRSGSTHEAHTARIGFIATAAACRRAA